MFALTLDAATYRIVAVRGTGSDGMHARLLECYPMVMELAIAPRATAQQRYTSWKASSTGICSTTQGVYPDFDLAGATNPSFDADGYHADTAIDTPSRAFYSASERRQEFNKFEVNYVKSWPFALSDVVSADEGPRTVTRWTLTATLGYNFLASGQLRLVLTHADDEPTEVCAFLSQPIAQRNHAHCIVGQNIGLNQHTISTGLETANNANYTLWLVEITGRRVQLGPSVLGLQCSPFAMTIDLRPVLDRENFISCDAELLPTSFNEPGMLSAHNHNLHYKERVLIDTNRKRQRVPFTLHEASIIKVFTASSRVDVDIELKRSDGAIVASSRRSAGNPDIVEVYLDSAGDYALEIVLFGSYDRLFCESYQLEVSVMSLFEVNFAHQQCSHRFSSSPDLSRMRADLAAAAHTFVAAGSYNMPLNRSSAAPFVVLAQSFDVSVPSFLDAQVGSNFLLGDLELTLTANFSDGETILYDSDRVHARNLKFLRTTLAPGVHYTLIVRRHGDLNGRGPSSLSRRPSCLPWSLSLTVNPYQTRHEICADYRELPHTFNSGEFFGLTDRMHLSETFAAPDRFFWFASEDVTLNLEQDSYIRAVTRSAAAITFAIRDRSDNAVLTSTRDPNTGEVELIGTLTKDTPYTFRVSFVFDEWEADPDTCDNFPLEMSIVPTSDVTSHETTCAQESMPGDSNNPLAPINTLVYKGDGKPDDGLFYTEQVYRFTQKEEAAVASMPFTLQRPAWLRAQLNYRFVTGDIALKLLRDTRDEGNNSGSLQTIGQSENMFDSDELWPRRLLPGKYILQIYEPAPQPVAIFRQCVDLELVVALQVDGNSEEIALDRPQRELCSRYRPTLPSSLNSVAFMSPFTGNQAHLSGYYWPGPNVKSGSSSVVPFNVTVPSYLRVVVTGSASLDVDITVRDSERRLIDGMSAISFREENVYGLLAPGTYYIQFKFYANLAQRFPTAEDCVGFPLELALLSSDHFLQQFPQQTNPNACPSPLSDLRINMDSQFSGSFSRWIDQSDPVGAVVSGGSVRSPRFVRSFNFEVGLPMALFEMSLRYTFTEGSLYFLINGTAESERYVDEKLSVTFHPEQSKNHLFLSLALEKGKYTVQIYDLTLATPATGQRSRSQWCSPFSISWKLSSELSASVCDRSLQLPKDLFTREGGSASVGGPQDAATGEIRYSASRVTLPESGSHNYISFKITRPSYVRVWTRSHPEDDVDIFFYDSAALTSLISWSVGVDETESEVVFLPPKPEPYVLDLNVFYRGSEDVCPYFSVEIAIENVETVASDFACPEPALVSLPDTLVSFPTTGADKVLSRRSYAFTASDVTRYGIDKRDMLAIARYSIRFDVLSSYYDLFVQLGHDFIASDMTMSLTRVSTTGPYFAPVASYGRSAGWATDLYNFASELRSRQLPQGQYVLNITLSLHNLATRPQQSCHRFTYSLSAKRNQTATPTPAPQPTPVPTPTPRPNPPQPVPKPPVAQPQPPTSLPNPPVAQPLPPTAIPNPPVGQAPSAPKPNPNPSPKSVAPVTETPEKDSVSSGVSAPVIIGLVVVVAVLAAAAAVGYWWWNKRRGSNTGPEQYVPLVQMEGSDDEEFLQSVNHDHREISDDQL